MNTISDNVEIWIVTDEGHYRINVQNVVVNMDYKEPYQFYRDAIMGPQPKTLTITAELRYDDEGRYGEVKIYESNQEHLGRRGPGKSARRATLSAEL